MRRGARDSYREGYQRSYESSRGGRGGYGRGGYESSRDSRDSRDMSRDGYDSPRGRYGYDHTRRDEHGDRYDGGRGGYGGHAGGYSSRGGRYGSRGDMHQYDSTRDYNSHRDSGHYGRPESRDAYFNKERTPSSSHSDSFSNIQTPVRKPLEKTASPVPTTTTATSASTSTSTTTTTRGSSSPWVKLLGMDETERMERVLGAGVKSEVDEIRRAHQANFFKLRDGAKKLQEIEKDTGVLQMQLSSLQAGINAYETYRSTRIDVINKITLLGD